MKEFFLHKSRASLANKHEERYFRQRALKLESEFITEINVFLMWHENRRFECKLSVKIITISFSKKRKRKSDN